MPPTHFRPGAGRIPLAVRLTVAALAATIVIGAARASAQTFREAEPGLTPGWVFTPTFVFSTAYDDNVTLAGHRSPTASDTVTVLTPSGDLQYRGRHTWVGMGYDGSWSLYRQLSQLNAYDQSVRIDTRHDLSRRVQLTLHDNFSVHPTTDIVGLLGVPFVRNGSRMNSARVEARVALAAHTSVSSAYSHEYIAFDQDTEYGKLLHGGTAHAVALRLSREMSRQVSVGGEYTFQRANITAAMGQFNIQQGLGTFAYQAAQGLRLNAAFGFARLQDLTKRTSQTGPSWRLGAEQQLERATVMASYVRSYVPSFGIGGTMQNEELSAGLHMPLARNRVYWQSSFAWRRNQPIDAVGLRLSSLWFQNWVGYALQRWLRVEGYYWRSQQDSHLAGGRVDRNRFGIQLVTAMPMRIH